MTSPVSRIVDAHLHFWDPARADWYPYLANAASLDMGDLAGMCRPFFPEHYRRESKGWPVEKVVHVCAAGPFIAAETRERDEMGALDPLLAAVIGGIRAEQTPAEAIALIEEQMASPRFRGVRTMGTDPGRVPPSEVLRCLASHGLVFDLLSRPDRLIDSAGALAPADDLVVVVEHAGWPQSAEASEYEAWIEGIRVLAERPSTFCKLSGISGPRTSVSTDSLRPWFEPALEAFGPDRCMIASNFPVDSCHGSFDDLFSTYDTLTSHLAPEDREKIFAANAERVYRI